MLSTRQAVASPEANFENGKGRTAAATQDSSISTATPLKGESWDGNGPRAVAYAEPTEAEQVIAQKSPTADLPLQKEKGKAAQSIALTGR